MTDQDDLLKRALDQGQVAPFLIGDQPYFFQGKQDLPEPQNVSDAMLLQVAPYWRLTKDERLPVAFKQGLLDLLQTYPDKNKALYVCSNWVRTYAYALMKKHQQAPIGAYAGMFEIDLQPVADLLRQELSLAKGSLEQDQRWAGVAWNSASGLWEPIISSAKRTREQFGGPDFLPQTA